MIKTFFKNLRCPRTNNPVIIFCAAFLISAQPVSVQAYEGPFHYLWTYNLALHAGFSERQAYQIASATFSLDWDQSTGPLTFGGTLENMYYGAERMRFYHPTINPLWLELQEQVKKVHSESGISPPFSTLATLQEADIESLGTIWSDYYESVRNITPEMRIWTRFHAFVPSSVLDGNVIDPFIKPHDSRDGWVATYNTDLADHSEMSQEVDEAVVGAFNALWSACESTSIDTCIEFFCKRGGLICGDAPYDLRSIQKLLKKQLRNRNVRGGSTDIRKFIDALSKRFELEKILGIDGEIVETKFSEVWDRFLKELNPTSNGQSFPPASPHGAYATAIRADAARALWKLAIKEKNPGALLHYIQDLQPHGDFDTVHGHAMNAHRPDFISNDLERAWRATVDTAQVLCQFARTVGADDDNFDIAPLQTTVPLPGENKTQLSFVWQVPDNNSICNSGKSGARVNMKHLEKLRPELEALASVNPTPSYRGLAANALEATFYPAKHYIKTDANLALPSLTKSVAVIRDRLRANYYSPNIENPKDIVSFWPALKNTPTNPNLLDSVFGERNKVPMSLIAYDFDVCGQVVNKGHGQSNASVSCLGTKREREAEKTEAAENGVSDDIQKVTAASFAVEDIHVSIGEMQAQRTLVSSEGYSTFRIDLDYKIEGFVPGLDGQQPVRQLDVADSGINSLLRRTPDNPYMEYFSDTRMRAIKGGAPIALSMAELPVLEHCSPIFEDMGDMPIRRSDIKYEGNEQQVFADKLIEKLRPTLPGRIYTTSEDVTRKARFTVDGIEPGVMDQRTSPITIACVIHVQGQRPIVMARQIGMLMDISFGAIRPGKTNARESN